MFLKEIDFGLTGYWLEYDSALLLSRPLDDVYEVRFSTAGDMASWVTQRTARFQDGFLILNEPVKEYSGKEYSRFKLFAIDENLILVPDDRIRNFLDEFDGKVSIEDRSRYIDLFTYKRLSTLP